MPFLHAAPDGLATYYGVNLRDYSTDGEDRNWGRGWPECSGPRGQVVTVVSPVSGARFPVHARVARMWSWWVDRAELVHGYRFKPANCGAYNCRQIAGTSRPSNHSWALAADVNWHDNPYRTPLVTDIPQAMIDDAADIGWAWGGRYGDAMHFEYMGTPQQADTITELLFAATENEDDDMAGALAFPLGAEESTGTGEDGDPRGHLEVIPVPPSNGAGAARNSDVWLNVACGWEPVTIYQLGARQHDGSKWSELVPFTALGDGEPYELAPGSAGMWQLPEGTTSVEIRYDSPEAFSALVEWRQKP